jgi:GDP-L-fucose synthase
MDRQPLRTLVAGGSGLIGSAVVRSLLAARPDTLVRATFWSTADRVVEDPRVEWMRTNLLDPAECRRAAHGCTWAVLSAAETGGVHHGVHAPWEQVTPNLIIAASLLDALHEAEATRVVVVGSATAYQAADGCIAETDLDWSADPGPPHFGAGWVARSVEKLCEFWRRSADIDIRVVRAANVFGPRARFAPERATFIPALIRKATDRQDPFEVWGSPDVVRDVIYSEDFAEAIVRLLTMDALNEWTFNVGSGRPLRVDDAVAAVLRACGHAPRRVTYQDEAGGCGTRSRVLDCRRALVELSWAPRIPLEDAIRMTAEWWTTARTDWRK